MHLLCRLYNHMGHLLSMLYRITKVLIFKLIRINILDISILVFKRREWWTIHGFYGYEYSIIVNSISKYFCTKCICPIGCNRITNHYPRYDQHKIRIIYSQTFSLGTHPKNMVFVLNERELPLDDSWCWTHYRFIGTFKKQDIQYERSFGLEYTAINRLVMCYWIALSICPQIQAKWHSKWCLNLSILTIEIIDIECVLMTNHVSTFSPCVPFWMRHFEFWPGVQTTKYKQN
jgi:hypothetical protein